MPCSEIRKNTRTRVSFIAGVVVALALLSFSSIARLMNTAELEASICQSNSVALTSQFPARVKEQDDKEKLVFLVGVAVCQEEYSKLSWMDDLCARTDATYYVSIYHKCNAKYPGVLHIPPLTEFITDRKWPSASCIDHVWNHTHLGREQEAHVSHIKRYYHHRLLKSQNTKLVFLQGEGPEEFILPHNGNSIGDALGEVSKTLGFASLSGRVFRLKEEHHNLATFLGFSSKRINKWTTLDVLQKTNYLPDGFSSDVEYVEPSRGQFIVSAERVKRIPFEVWKQLHELAKIPIYHHDPFEHTWALMFNCLYPTSCPDAQERIEYAYDAYNGKLPDKIVGLECYDDLKLKSKSSSLRSRN
jgi:hypothetical protein